MATKEPPERVYALNLLETLLSHPNTFSDIKIPKAGLALRYARTHGWIKYDAANDVWKLTKDGLELLDNRIYPTPGSWASWRD
jgi:hypothetical protein